MLVKDKELLASKPTRLKFIFNNSGIVFGSAAAEHQALYSPGITYHDERGTALAGSVVMDHVEIRGHSVLNYNLERVQGLWTETLKQVNDPYLSSLPAMFKGVYIYQPPKTVQQRAV